MGCGPNPWPAYEAIPALSLGFLEWPGSYGAERRGQCYAHGDIPTPSAPVVSPWSPAAGRLFPRCPRPTGSGFSLGNPGWPHPFLPSSCTARAIDRRPGLYPPSPRGGGRAKRAQSRGGAFGPRPCFGFAGPKGRKNAAAPPPLALPPTPKAQPPLPPNLPLPPHAPSYLGSRLFPSEKRW